MTLTQIRSDAKTETCLCGKEIAQSRRFDGRVTYVHTGTGKAACYPESLNPEDADYYRATPAAHPTAA